MKKEVKQQWCRALKSGKFEQAKEQLLDQDSGAYCCLGVLTRLYCQDKKVPFSKVNGSEPGENDVLNQKVIDWAGLKEQDPIVNGKTLSQWNDTGTSFKEIATLIQKAKL